MRFLGLLCVFATIFFILAAIISAFRKTGKVKKMLLSSVGSFILLFVVAFIAVAIEDAETSNETEPVVEKNSISANETMKSEESQEEDLEDEWFPESDSTREEKIEDTINSIIDKNYSHTNISDMEVNENLGLNDGSNIVLPHLKFDAMNNEKRTKNLIEMYSEDLAANLAKEEDIS
ncbi:hypothetical protein AS888_08020 [Peribacillus simplex]|uniref:Uncharacterized protein n=1 Tax=Peribacillus simplex TaxID=1478 RepID=A0A120GNG0_9BACI|nr:hypothetical protein [Peribacillus simplex]KWW15470.1 hypothetical protein AS888_08020 [Peribacillus simplex]